MVNRELFIGYYLLLERNSGMSLNRFRN